MTSFTWIAVGIVLKLTSFIGATSGPPPDTTTQVPTPAQTAGTVCHTNPTDIVFLLDSSSSETRDNFKKQLSFVSDIVKDFDIAPNKVQVSAITFSTTVVNAFWLNAHTTKASLLQAIPGITYLTGRTKTSDALSYALNNNFKPAHGGRPGSDKVVIVLTDGQSDNPNKTAAVADRLHKAHIRVIAIGIGNNIFTSELAAVASSPLNVFNVSSFTSLTSIKSAIQKRTCTVITPKPTPKPVTVAPTQAIMECYTKPADIVFLVDSSGSEGAVNFQTQLTFVSSLVNTFNIGPDKARVSLARFSTAVRNAFWLDDHLTKPDIISAIKSVSYSSGNTATDLALTHALQQSFSVTHGARNDSSKILIVLTDGQSYAPQKTSAAANLLHNTNIRVIAIGIGNNIDRSELSTIASDSKLVYTVANFSGLANIENEIQQQTCTKIGPVCKSNPADILFILDTSRSEGNTNFHQQLTFVGNFSKDFAIGPTAVQIAVATFGTNTKSEFWFSDHATKPDLLAAINKIKYRDGNTQTALALQFGKVAFTSAHGARNNSSHIIIILTDGQSADKSATKLEANNVHNTGIQVIAIGIGNSVNQQEIKDIASGDGDQNAFSVANFTSLNTIEKALQTQTCTAQTVCSSRAVDVVFLLDSSGSEGSANFHKQLDFVNNFARQTIIGPDNIQVSVVTFASTVMNEFWLNNHTNRIDLLNDIQNISFRGGNTNTADGLQFVKHNSFLPQHGGRPTASQVVIVVTDGQSQDKASTANKAEQLHRDGIKVVSVGVGKSIDSGELTAIASASSFVFKVANFDALQQIETSVRQTTCKSPQPVCKSDPADIVFLLDSSTSEGSVNFKKQLQFVSSFADGFDITPKAIQIGVVTYSTDVHNRFYLNAYPSKAALKASITSIPFTAGDTNTGDGLLFIRTNSLSQAHGERPNAHQVVIVMTDGQSQRTSYTAQQAKMLHKNNVKVIAIGIGAGIKNRELTNIASDAKHVFKVRGFDALKTIELELQHKTCNKLECASNAADLVFVLDSSGSEGTVNFQKQVTFVHNFLSKFDISSSAAQCSVVVFSDRVYPQFDLDAYSTKAALLAAVSNISYYGGLTQTATALEYVNQASLTPGHGARPNASKIVIVMTDGQSQYQGMTKQQATFLHQRGVEVLAIGIGSGVNQVELQSIASDNKHVFSVANFDALYTLQKELAHATCAAQVTVLPPTATVTAQLPVTTKVPVVVPGFTPTPAG